MTTQAIITCVILVITMVLLISQKVPLVILGAAIPAALAATGVINAGSAYTEFGNTTIVFFMGLVVVGEAFFKTGLADFIGGKIIGLLGKTEKGLLLGTGLVAGGLSAFLNDTGSTACLMPIVSSMASKAGVKKSKLLMALAFFASLGGTITLVGTTPHIVANGILKDMGLREFGFFEYTKIGLPLLVCGILYMCFCGTKLLPDKDIEIKGGDRVAEYDTKKMVLVALIFIGVLVAMATSIVPMHIAGVIGAILVVVTGCISLEEAIKAFPTSTIFIVGGIFPLSKALVSSGAAEYLVNAISPVLSNLPPIHEKTPIGRLSAYCGAISAGAGAGAGIAYLCGGDYDAVIHTVVNALAVVSGVICDGAKASCAAKIATAVEAGLLGYNMYIRGNQFRAGDGIVAKGVENSLKNVGRLGKQGMKETNNEIIAIMVGC